jgi:hypothetical protein
MSFGIVVALILVLEAPPIEDEHEEDNEEERWCGVPRGATIYLAPFPFRLNGVRATNPPWQRN